MSQHAPTTPTPSNRSTYPTRTSSLNPAILTPRLVASTLLHGYTPTTTSASASTVAAAAAASGGGLYLHHSEDPLVFEIGARLLRVGFANEGVPRCELEWKGGVFWRREGHGWWGKEGGGGGGEGGGKGELWRKDLRSVDMGVVEDVLERGVRMAYNKYLLLDSKIKRLILITPSHFPTPLLTSITKSLFAHFQMPGIMLLDSATMCALSAGTRSALVLDLGWEEAVVSTIYELRTLATRAHLGRSRRGGRLLQEKWRGLLESTSASASTSTSTPQPPLPASEVDDILSRLSWCRDLYDSNPDSEDTDQQQQQQQQISIPLSTGHTITLPFSRLSAPVEATFFAPTTTPSPTPDYADDDDTPIPRLVYEALRGCPVDVRAACMQRIIIVGGAAQVPGLKKRVVDEVRVLVERVGWGAVGVRRRPGEEEVRKVLVLVPVPVPKIELPVEESRGERIVHSEDEGEVTEEEGGYGWNALSPGAVARAPRPKVRGVESLGAWVGASLVAGMKGRGNVEVEREKFLSTVAAGGSGFPFGF